MSRGPDIRTDVWTAFRGCRLWLPASDAAVTRLARSARIDTVARGTHLATEGDAASEFGLVVTGKARAFYLGADGRQITFETITAGQPFGVVEALAGSRYPANIDAATPTTVARASAESLYALLDAEPRVARTLISDLASKVVDFTTVVATLSLDVPSRVARYVLHRVLKEGRSTPRGLEVTLGMKKGDLAMSLGTVPETLSRAFARLASDEVLEVSGQQVTVLDMRALAALSSGYDAEV